MERGVVYMLSSLGYAELLAVSLCSLRQHYDGPITIFATHDCLAIANRCATSMCCDVVPFELLRLVGQMSRRIHTQSKVIIYLRSPYDYSIMFDVDTIVRGAIDDMFQPSDCGFCVTTLDDMRLLDDHHAARSAWHEVRAFRRFGWYGKQMVEAAKRANYPIINTGVFGWRRGDPLLAEIHHLVLAARSLRCSDESVINLLANRMACVQWMPPKWNSSVWLRSEWGKQKIVHLNAGGWWNHPQGCECFRKYLQQAIDANAGGLATWAGRHNRKIDEVLNG